MDVSDTDNYNPVTVLRTLQELKKMRTTLVEENDNYRQDMRSCKAAMEQSDLEISANEAALNAVREKRDAQIEEIENLRLKQGLLVEKVNNMRLKLKAVDHDNKSSSIMFETMSRELESIENEKEAMQKRLTAVDSGIQSISSQRSSKLPNVMGQDLVLKNIYRIFKEAEDRMELSIRFKGTDHH